MKDVVAFECISGRMAFEGANLGAVLGRLLFGETPRLLDVVPGIPPAIDDLVNYGAFTEEMAAYLQAAVATRLNIIVSGGTGCTWRSCRCTWRRCGWPSAATVSWERR